MSKPLGDYLYEYQKRGVIDFCLRASEQDGVMQFYVRPANRDGETADYHVVGNLTIQAMVNGTIQRFPVALAADCVEFAMELPNDSCPKCHTVQSGTLGEKPWFWAIGGGRSPNTPDGPGESWVEGIQTCYACGHQWTIEL